jgi:predicted transcriptional regulator
MPNPEPLTLEQFHQFIGEQLQSDGTAHMTPEQALAAWRERQDSIAGIQEGLADIEAGRTKSLDDFLAEFQARHGIAGE